MIHVWLYTGHWIDNPYGDKRWNHPEERVLAYPRAEVALGRPSLVGTLVKCPEKLPEHLLAEEKPTWLEGHKRYLSPPWQAVAY